MRAGIDQIWIKDLQNAICMLPIHIVLIIFDIWLMSSHVYSVGKIRHLANHQQTSPPSAHKRRLKWPGVSMSLSAVCRRWFDTRNYPEMLGHLTFCQTITWVLFIHSCVFYEILLATYLWDWLLPVLYLWCDCVLVGWPCQKTKKCWTQSGWWWDWNTPSV